MKFEPKLRHCCRHHYLLAGAVATTGAGADLATFLAFLAFWCLAFGETLLLDLTCAVFATGAVGATVTALSAAKAEPMVNIAARAITSLFILNLLLNM
jgi:hypothetical protein